MSYNTELQSNNADLQEILDAVNALPDAGAELPELTNPGTAGDLVYGKEMIDANGNVVTGSLRPKLGGLTADVAPQTAGGSMPYVKLIHTVSERTLIDPAFGGQITFQAPFEAYGDAAAADVAKGKTFTSAAGLQVAGTHIPLDTSDATATAEQMPEGVIAYVNGEKVTGTAKTVRGSYSKTVTPSFTSAAGGAIKLIQMVDTIVEPTFFGTTGDTDLALQAQASEFGDATAEDVAKGKTFTSAAGLKAVGTKEESGGIETVQVTVNVVNWNGSVWYTDESYSFQSLSTLGSAIYEIACLKNSPVIFSGYGFTPSIEAGYEIPYEEDMSANGMYIYHFTEDCTIMVEGTGGGIEAPED